MVGFVAGLVCATIAIDFNNPAFPEWSLFEKDQTLPPGNAHGAKAAMLALLATVTLFIGIVPSEDSRLNKQVSLSNRVLGIISTGVAGWYWLLSTTEGNPGPYLLVMVPTSGILVAIVMSNFILGYAVAYDERQMKEKGYTKVNWAIVIPGLAVITAAAIFIFIIAYLPDWVF